MGELHFFVVQINNVQETNGGLHSGDGWKTETLHVADVPSSGHYEELKNENSNFKHSKEIR